MSTTSVKRMVLRINPAGVQRVAQGDHIHFHYLTPDNAPGPREVEMCCHACGKASIVVFSMSPITVQPTPHRQRELDKIRDEFVKAHVGCTRDEKFDYRTGCPQARNGDHTYYDLSIGVN